jgi:membrane carboxypeptidase/penicillin-binding protein
MTDQTQRNLLAYFVCTLPLVLGVVWMGFDNAAQLARCEATGRVQAECRLLVLGR